MTETYTCHICGVDCSKDPKAIFMVIDDCEVAVCGDCQEKSQDQPKED